MSRTRQETCAPVAGLKWLEHRLNALATVALHAGAVLAIVFVRPRWSDALIGAGFYLAGMFVITAGYHRYFAHRSYKTSRVFQAVLAMLGCLCTQKGALWWAATHRQHHRFTDTERDPHSPHQRGFWHSHILWTLSSESDGHDPIGVRDLSRYPELRWLDRFFLVPPTVLAVVVVLVGLLLERYAPGLRTSSLQMLVYGFGLSTVLLYHSTFAVNSLTHVFGRRRFATKDHSRNNWLIALVTLGEGWHNNHHYYPASERQGFYWWEIDLTHYVLTVLAWCHIVWAVRTPSERIYRVPIDPK